jgi:hypothetical protein
MVTNQMESIDLIRIYNYLIILYDFSKKYVLCLYNRYHFAIYLIKHTNIYSNFSLLTLFFFGLQQGMQVFFGDNISIHFYYFAIYKLTLALCPKMFIFHRFSWIKKIDRFLSKERAKFVVND